MLHFITFDSFNYYLMSVVDNENGNAWNHKHNGVIHLEVFEWIHSWNNFVFHNFHDVTVDRECVIHNSRLFEHLVNDRLHYYHVTVQHELQGLGKKEMLLIDFFSET